MKHLRQWLAVALFYLPFGLPFGLPFWFPGMARADVDQRLTTFEQEARQISQNLPQPEALGGVEQPQRQLVDAKVAFSLGDYDNAALALFELATRQAPEQEEATYYLAETLMHKGDRGAARTYYQQVIARNNVGGKQYQPSLIRLIEIAIAQQDPTDVDTHIASLDRTMRVPQIPYVKGKWAFSQGKHDEAIAFFNEVPRESPLDLQAQYYIGTTSVANKDLARATQVFEDISKRRPKTANDRRVIELSQLALGRVYYERDQLAKSIDSYLLVDRHSDLFPDALYECSWVYVKSKQYDKALRALELLALSSPNSTRTPTVRILEGNLRIRQARLNRQAIITNTLDAGAVDPATEYARASAVFTETHDAYYPSYVALKAMLDGVGDPADYLAQLAERSQQAFQASLPIPDAAAQYLREEPEVERAVNNQLDLEAVRANLAVAEQTVARLEAIVTAKDRNVVFPVLAARRGRINEMQAELIGIRNDLADQQLSLIVQNGEVASLSSARKSLAAQWRQMPNADQAYGDRLEKERTDYDKLSESTYEISGALDTGQAGAVALRKYITDKPEDGAQLVTDDQRAQVKTELVATAAEVASIEAELRELRREIQLGRDLAGIGDVGLAAARDMRRKVKDAQDNEHRVLAGFASASKDSGRSKQLAALGDRAARIAADLDQTERKIENVVDRALDQTKILISRERVNIDEIRSELNAQELESRQIGGGILGASFANVKTRFYDIVIRTDVGSVDVLWSQKEDADDDLKRLNLSRSRELKLLKDEFKEILDTTQSTTPATPTPEPNIPKPAAPSGSPDKGEGGDRIKPGGDDPKQKPAPTVRPDNETAPKDPKTAPKGGAKK